MSRSQEFVSKCLDIGFHIRSLSGSDGQHKPLSAVHYTLHDSTRTGDGAGALETAEINSPHIDSHQDRIRVLGCLEPKTLNAPIGEAKSPLVLKIAP